MTINETMIQASANGLLMIAFFAVAFEQYRLHLAVSYGEHATRLGKAMERKYIAWAIASFLLGVLQSYSFYFNLTKEVGIFVFEVRNTLRVLAVIALIIAYLRMRAMRRELDRTEGTEVREPDDEHESA